VPSVATSRTPRFDLDSLFQLTYDGDDLIVIAVCTDQASDRRNTLGVIHMWRDNDFRRQILRLDANACLVDI
jgi:hypothetical protein